MNRYQFEISATLKDESAATDAAVHLGMALAKIGDISVVATEQSEALGMSRNEIILSIIISFTTSVVATAATDAIKAALKDVHTSAVLHVDVTYDSHGSTPSKENSAHVKKASHPKKTSDRR